MVVVVVVVVVAVAAAVACLAVFVQRNIYIYIYIYIQFITLGNKILEHERCIVFLTCLFTLNSNMQSKFLYHP